MPLIAGVPAPNLADKLEGEVFRERSGVRYRRLKTRTLLNRCASPNVPFDWTANPYRGCAMGCRYCYAAYTHAYVGLDPQADFHTTILAKTGGEALTERLLARAAARGELVALGTATDPYQPGEGQLRITRRLLEAAARQRGLRLSITTKGALVLRDLDLLARIHARSRLTVSVSLISPRAALLRRLEPRAAPPAVRLEALRRLAEAGLDAALAISPVLPGITDAEADLDELMARASSAGVRRAWCQLVFLRSPTREVFLDFVAREFPRLARAYRRAFAGGAFLQGPYRERTLALVARLARRHGLALGQGDATSGSARAVQLELWSRPAPAGGSRPGIRPPAQVV